MSLPTYFIRQPNYRQWQTMLWIGHHPHILINANNYVPGNWCSEYWTTTII